MGKLSRSSSNPVAGVSLGMLQSAVVVISLGISSAYAIPQLTPLQPTPTQIKVDKAVQMVMKQGHFLHPHVDDELSGKIFDAYFKELDYSRSVFLKADMDTFEASRNQLDDAILLGDLSVAYKIYNTFLTRINERYDFAISLLQKPMKFDGKDRFEYDREKSPWPKTLEEANDIWRARVKNDALSEALKYKPGAAKWEDIRNTLTKRYETARKRINQSNSEDVFSRFMNAFTMSIDPHSNYMSPEQTQNFDIEMSLKVRGIGAQLQADDDYIKVASIVPASPAEKSKQLFPDDRIVGVAQGEGNFTDVIGWRVDDAVKLIRGEVGTTVRLEVLPHTEPLGGKTKIVSIVRAEIILDEQRAKSNIINVEEHGKTYQVGVITVPRFYVNFEERNAGNENYTSSARDVKQLLEKLKLQNIDAVVLDLRDNGGGGLDEAVDMVGLFIDKGPVVQERDPQGHFDVSEDKDPSVTWSGPLTVLVNGQSASASEITAAALQDYGRALVIGETTFGKGTVQQLAELNNFRGRSDDDFGTLKYTMRKFYRIDGSSTQHRGVVPDLNLPGTYDQSIFGESSLPNAMPWDRVQPKKYTKVGDPTRFIGDLKKLEEKRVARNDEFQYLVQDIAEYNARRAEKSVSLNEVERRAERDKDQAKELARENARRAKKNLPALKALPETPDTEKLPDVRLAETTHVVADYVWLQSGTQRLVESTPAANGKVEQRPH